MHLVGEIPGTWRARRTLFLSLAAALSMWPFFDRYMEQLMDRPDPPAAAVDPGATTWDLRSMWN